jgi:CheY-like chemotaxis protein
MSKQALIIEDSDNFIDFYKHFLAEYDCVVDVVETVEEATEKVQQKIYDLFIIDIKLKTETKGIDLIGNGAYPENSIVISNYLDKETVDKLIQEYKMDKHHLIKKPVDPDTLKKCIHHILLPDQEWETKKEDVEKIMPAELAIGLWKKIFGIVRNFINNMGFKSAVVTLVIIAMLYNFIPIYNTWHDYNHALEHHTEFVEYCESRFKHYKEGETVGSNTYLQEQATILDHEIVFRIYPDDIVRIIIYHHDKEPDEYWLGETDEFYLNKQGISTEKKSFFKIFIEHFLGKVKIG